MRIVIILEHKNDIDSENSLKVITKEDNYKYLEKEDDDPNFPCLSEVEICDHAVFNNKSMDHLIKELLMVKDEVSNLSDKKHIDEIIEMAKICKDDPNLVLIFSG